MTPTKIFGLLLVVAYIAGLKILTALDIGSIFEHRLILPILNTLFAGVIPVVVAYVAGRNYLKGGSLTSLFMGCGMLSFGLCAISAGWLIRASDGANLNVTVYNTGALLGSGFHAIGAILSLVGIDYSDEMKQRRMKARVAYIGILLFVICFSLAALGGLVPPFFVQGVGPTGLRQAILGSSVFLYFMSAIFLMAFHFRSKSNFLYWYSLCLAMLAIGLLAFFVQKSVGSPIGWLGRSANYFGGIFALVAVLGALRNEKAKGVTPEKSVFTPFVNAKSSYRIGLIPVLPLPIILILFVILASVDTRTVFDPPGLLAALNTLFISILPLVVVYVATKGYLRGGNLTMLMLGSATLTLALGSPLAGWVITLEGGGPNANVTVFNLAALFSATFHLLGGVLAFTGSQPRKNASYKILILVLTYLGIAVLLTLLTSATLKGLIPVFFVQGEGSTVWRHNVLLTATVFFTFSGVLFTVLYLFSRAKFLYWYSLALFLFATALIGLLLLKSVGSPIGWTARTALYLSGMYLLMSVVSASRDVRARGESLDSGIANLFRHHLELLVEKRTMQLSQAKEELQAAHAELERGNAELFRTNQQLRALMDALPVGVSFSDDTSCQRISGNPCLFAQFEITPEDNISASVPDPDAPGRLVRYFHNGREVGDDELPLQRAVAENKIIPPIEFEVRLPSGRRWFTDVSGAPIFDEQGKVVGGVAVTVDITEHKRAEEALQRSETMLRAVLENMPSGVAVRDAQTGALIISNERTRQLMGDLVETPDQSPRFRCFHPDGRQYRTEEWPIVRSMSTGEVVDSEEVQVERSDGSLITLSFSSAPVRDSQGRIVAGVVVGHDITERKKAEQDLRTTLQRFYAILSSQHAGLLLVTEEGRIEFANQAFCDQFGLGVSPSALLGLAPQDIIQRIQDVYAEPAQAINRINEIVQQWASVKGEEITIRGAKTYLRDFFPIQIDGKHLGRLWQHQDITERKRAEEALRQAMVNLEIRVQERTAELEQANQALQKEMMERLRAEDAVTRERQQLYNILETMPIIVCLLTPDHRIAFANRSFREKFGEDTDRHCFDLIFGLKEPCEFCEAYDVLKTGKPHNWEVTGPDGSIFDVYNSPFTDIDGSPLILELDIDITERKRAEEAIRAAGTYNRRLIEASLDPLVTISAEGKVTDVNSATEKVTGHSREELIGTDFADYFSDYEKARLGYEQVFRNGSIKNYELMIRHKNGWLTPVIYNASLYRDDSGKAIGIFAAARDITERKRAEEDLIQSNQDLQQFAYVASHDLQEPLRNVASCLQMLEKKYKNNLDAEADQYIDYAVEAAVRMKTLVLDLLAYSRVATRGKPPEQVDCEHILDQAVSNLRVAISEAGAVITHDPLPAVYADDSQLLQVFQNLIQNAIKFRRDEPSQVHVSAVKNKKEWVFSVKDNGIGIEQRHLERIFVIFQRLHRRSEYDGTGIGLAIFKKVVERHGGRVWVESEPSVGSTFYFTIPEARIRI